MPNVSRRPGGERSSDLADAEPGSSSAWAGLLGAFGDLVISLPGLRNRPPVVALRYGGRRSARRGGLDARQVRPRPSVHVTFARRQAAAVAPPPPSLACASGHPGLSKFSRRAQPRPATSSAAGARRRWWRPRQPVRRPPCPVDAPLAAVGVLNDAPPVRPSPYLSTRYSSERGAPECRPPATAATKKYIRSSREPPGFLLHQSRAAVIAARPAPVRSEQRWPQPQEPARAGVSITERADHSARPQNTSRSMPV